MSHYKGNTYIYTDGACQGNGTDHSIGGWAFVCDRYDDTNGGCRKQITRYGGEAGATNNSMELRAVLQALQFSIRLWIFLRHCIFCLIASILLIA